MTTPRDLAERCFEIPARVDRIVHLAVVGDSMEADLFEWLAEYAADVLGEQFGRPFEEVIEIYGGRDEERNEALTEAFAHTPVLGWLIEVSTPDKTPNPITPGTGFSYSWGRYHSKVFYSYTYEGALEAGLTWAESTIPGRSAAGTK